MKKAFLLLMICFSAFTYQASASFLGISINITRGRTEWNSTHTAVSCVGTALVCTITFGNRSMSLLTEVEGMPAGEGGLFNNNGNLSIVLPISTLSDPAWSQIFTGNALSLTSDIELSMQEQAELGGGCPSVISAGDYPYVIQGNVVIVDL